MSDASAPRKPNLATDRIILVTGGTIPKCFNTPLLVVRPGTRFSTWRTIPTEPVPAGVWPRDGGFNVQSQVQCGTVDELVEIFRGQLTRAVRLSFGLDGAGEDFTRDAWRSNEMMQQWLASRGVDVPVCSSVNPHLLDRISVTREAPEFQAREAQRREILKAVPPARLSEADRELVNDFIHYGTSKYRSTDEWAEVFVAYREDAQTCLDRASSMRHRAETARTDEARRQAHYLLKHPSVPTVYAPLIGSRVAAIAEEYCFVNQLHNDRQKQSEREVLDKFVAYVQSRCTQPQEEPQCTPTPEASSSPEAKAPA